MSIGASVILAANGQQRHRSEMASLDPHLLDKELKALLKTSQAIKNLTWDVLEQIESDPS